MAASIRCPARGRAVPEGNLCGAEHCRRAGRPAARSMCQKRGPLAGRRRVRIDDTEPTEAAHCWLQAAQDVLTSASTTRPAGRSPGGWSPCRARSACLSGDDQIV
jgi:hypothetical protein